MRGILYSPVAASLSVSISTVSAGFMAEFQLMFAMYRNKVSMGYGSPLQALWMTICIMPWAASGASHENALSMRPGVPSASIIRSSGPAGKPSGGPASGVPGATWSGRPVGLIVGGQGFGKGGL